MKRLVIREHTVIVRASDGGTALAPGGQERLEHSLFDRLKRFDHSERDEVDRIFAWGDGAAKTQQWVGVVQVPGLQVEILPKVDALDGEDGERGRDAARRNLLYMLGVAGDVPVRSRDVARLASRRAPLSETLAAIFADRLVAELLRGPERTYVNREETLRGFKGKLLVAEQALHNAAHRERFICRYDELSEDTPMNQVFRAACRVLLDATHTPATQDILRHALLLLDGVSDVTVHDATFDRVAMTRQNERFADVFGFCRLILRGRAPTAEAGEARSFSLLFDMNQVFERFVAGFLRRRVMPRLAGHELFPQARRRGRHLMQLGGHGALPLKPDLLIEAPGGARLVMDTKWKRLSGSGRRGGVAGADLYQLFAYTRRYGCKRSVLLYPRAPGAMERDFDVLDPTGAHSGEQVCVRFVNLHRNLHLESEREALANELMRIVADGLQVGAAENDLPGRPAPEASVG